jgi:hypothetical protein
MDPAVPIPWYYNHVTVTPRYITLEERAAHSMVEHYPWMPSRELPSIPRWLFGQAVDPSLV